MLLKKLIFNIFTFCGTYMACGKQLNVLVNVFLNTGSKLSRLFSMAALNLSSTNLISNKRKQKTF